MNCKNYNGKFVSTKKKRVRKLLHLIFCGLKIAINGRNIVVISIQKIGKIFKQSFRLRKCSSASFVILDIIKIKKFQPKTELLSFK